MDPAVADARGRLSIIEAILPIDVGSLMVCYTLLAGTLIGESRTTLLEQEFRLSEMSLIYIPFYDFTLEYKDKMRTIRLNGMTGEIKEV